MAWKSSQQKPTNIGQACVFHLSSKFIKGFIILIYDRCIENSSYAQLFLLKLLCRHQIFSPLKQRHTTHSVAFISESLWLVVREAPLLMRQNMQKIYYYAILN